MAEKKEALTDEEAADVRHEELVAAVQEVFHSPAGQIVLGWMSSQFGFIRRSTHVPGDPCTSSLNEGMRLVCVEIGKLLESEAGETRGTNTAEM